MESNGIVLEAKKREKKRKDLLKTLAVLGFLFATPNFSEASIPLIHHVTQGEDSKNLNEMTLISAQFELFRTQSRITISDERHLPSLRHHNKKTEYSALLIHGLYGSPHHMKYIQEQLHQMGINTVSWLLPGHYQRDYKVLDEVTFDDWIKSGREGLKWAQKIGEKVILVGFSTGATINTIFASEGKNKIAGQLLFAPAYKVSWLSYIGAYTGNLAGIVGNDIAFGPPNGKNISYYSPKAAIELQKMSDTFRQQYPTYRHLNMPTALFGFSNDFTVDENELENIAAEAPGMVHYLRIPMAARGDTWVFATFEPPVEFAMTKILLNHGMFPGLSWETSWKDRLGGKTISVKQAVVDWFNRVKDYARQQKM